ILAKLFNLHNFLQLGDKSRIVHEDELCIYLCGQSLGLKPKSADKYVERVLKNWGELGVCAHFSGYLPAALCDLHVKAPMAKLVGAKASEVAVMNGLSVNLHILMSSFYKPTPQRHKIIIEEHAFSSDMFAVKSQIVSHGYSPETSLVVLKLRPNEHTFREEDVLDVIAKEGDKVALILLFGVQYYSGQYMNIAKLTDASHKKGIIVGLDCAHVIGNVPLRLNEWNVDFAVWCTYKYLNSGPGCLGGAFVHEKFTEKGGNSQMPMLKAWWGNDDKTKFLLKEDFEAAEGTDMFRMSNPPPLLVATLKASLDIFSQTSVEELQGKQFLLTGYLEYLLKQKFLQQPFGSKFHLLNKINKEIFKIITPSDPKQRGAQLSLMFNFSLIDVQEQLQKRGVVCDIRVPNVMRVSPVPMYNSFQDVWNFVNILATVIQEIDEKCDNILSEQITEMNGIHSESDSLNK
ncbi:kynureninase-like isoform X2, partial [Dinothrombium tinctorium]